MPDKMPRRSAGLSLLLLLSLLMAMVPSLATFAQTDGTPAPPAAPAEIVDPAPVAPAPVVPEPTLVLPGQVRISLYGDNGLALAGLFAITDAAGAYHEVWVEGGFGVSGDLAAGPATVEQISGTTDYWFDGTVVQYAQVPVGDVTVLQFVNTFVDTDGDGIGDSADSTPSGEKPKSDEPINAPLRDTPAAVKQESPSSSRLAPETGLVEPMSVVTQTGYLNCVQNPDVLTVSQGSSVTLNCTYLYAGASKGWASLFIPEFTALDSAAYTATVSIVQSPSPNVTASATNSSIKVGFRHDRQQVSITIVITVLGNAPVGRELLREFTTCENNGGSASSSCDGAMNGRVTVRLVVASSQRAITVTAEAKSKVYGNADPVLTYNVTSGSLLPGDSFSGNISRVPGENIGSYNINQGNLQLGSNYTLTFVSANLTIGKRPITVTADNQTTVYGEADPALTYSVGPFANGDNASIITGQLSRGSGENVGLYPIGQGTLSLGSNYTVEFTGADLTITPRLITVTADAKTKAFGEDDPELTFLVTSGSLVESDVFSGVLSRDAGEGVGQYNITQGTLALNANYTLTYESAKLTITHITLAEGTHYTFACAPTPLSATSFTAVESTCTVTAKTLPSGSTISVNSITTTLAQGEGWSVALANSGGSFGTLSGVSTLTGVTLASGESYSFRVIFTPTACSAAASPPTVGVTLGMTAVIAGAPGPAHTTSARSVSATFTAPATSRKAVVIAAPNPVNVPYNMTTPQPGTASFTVRYTVSGCQTWSGSAAMSTFSKLGDPSQVTVPSLVSASQGSTTQSGAGSTVATTTAISTVAPTQTQLITGTAPGQEVVVDHSVNLTYTIPANTLVGTYQATITVTSGDGP